MARGARRALLLGWLERARLCVPHHDLPQVRLRDDVFFGGKRGWLLVDGSPLGLGPLLEHVTPPEFMDASWAGELSPRTRPVAAKE